MVAIHNNLLVNADLPPNNADNGTDATGAPTDPATLAAVAGALAPQPAAGIASSSFDGTKPGVTGNVLNTAPPALGGGHTVPVALAEAMGRMQQLQNGAPFRSALMRSAEDGTAPAVPSHATVGAGVNGSTPATGPAPTPAASPNGLPQVQTLAATPPAATSSSSSTINLDGQSDNVNVGAAGEDVQTEASQIQSDAASTTQRLHGCSKNDDFTGEDALAQRIQGMGVPKDQARTLASMLNPINNGSDTNQSPKDQQVVALAIAAYDKLNSTGNKDGAQQIVKDLTDVANTNKDSVKSTAGSQAFYKAINALGNYAIGATSSSATTSLTSPGSSARIVPYPIIGD
jgi:hypothetical protein